MSGDADPFRATPSRQSRLAADPPTSSDRASIFSSPMQGAVDRRRVGPDEGAEQEAIWTSRRFIFGDHRAKARCAAKPNLPTR